MDPEGKQYLMFGCDLMEMWAESRPETPERDIHQFLRQLSEIEAWKNKYGKKMEVATGFHCIVDFAGTQYTLNENNASLGRWERELIREINKNVSFASSHHSSFIHSDCDEAIFRMIHSAWVATMAARINRTGDECAKENYVESQCEPQILNAQLSPQSNRHVRKRITGTAKTDWKTKKKIISDEWM